MAEALLRHLGKNKFDVYSAGIESAEVNQNAVKVMAEIGIDISGQSSKTVERYLNKEFDEVITVCDSAEQACPFFANAKNRRHWDLPDPEKVQGTEEEIFEAFRDSRDSIKAKTEASLLA
jgi:arsenate reductase